jgi:hypothetical protein
MIQKISKTVSFVIVFLLALSSCGELQTTLRSANRLIGMAADSTSLFSERLTRGAGKGLVESLTTPEARRRLDSLVGELTATLRDTALSPVTERRVDSLGQRILATLLNDAKFNRFLDSVGKAAQRNLRAVLNDALGAKTGRLLRERITIDVLGDETNERVKFLLDSTVRPSLDSTLASLFVTVAKGVNGPLRGAVDSLVQQQTSTIKTELADAQSTLKTTLIGAGAALAAMAIVVAWFWRRHRTAQDVSKTLTFQIEKFGSKDLKNAIHEAAHQRKVDADLDAILKEQGILAKSRA